MVLEASMESMHAVAGRSPAEVHDGDRITDDDGAEVADDIAAAAGAGLVDLAEADGLLGRAWRARTGVELAATLDCLPAGWLAARRRAQAVAATQALARRELAGHALRWLGLVALLVAIWALTTPGGYFWPVWPALGTGSCFLRVAAVRRRVGGLERGAGRATACRSHAAGAAS